jgi:hypothetical protein
MERRRRHVACVAYIPIGIRNVFMDSITTRLWPSLIWHLNVDQVALVLQRQLLSLVWE